MLVGNQTAPDVAIDAAGDFVVVWQSPGQDGSGYGVFATVPRGMTFKTPGRMPRGSPR